MIDAPIKSHVAPPDAPKMTPAGFWIRFLALSVDGIILTIIYSVCLLLLVVSKKLDLIIPIIMGLSFLYDWMFHALYQATPGKMLCGIEVRTKSFQKISWGSALIRTLIKIGFGLALFAPLSWVPSLMFVISGLMVAFSAQKRALHDLASKAQPITSRGISVWEALGVYAVSHIMLVVFFVAGGIFFGATLKNNAGYMLSTYLEQNTFLSPQNKTILIDILESKGIEFELDESVTKSTSSTQPRQAEGFEASPYRHKLHSMQFVSREMYHDFLTALDPKAFEVDQDMVQSFGPILAVPSRTGIQQLTIEYFFPFIPNALAHPDALVFSIKPAKNDRGQPVTFSQIPPVFEIQEHNGTQYMHGTSVINYEGVPLSTLEVAFDLKLPTNVRKVKILRKSIEEEYYQHQERISNVEANDNQLSFNIAGIIDNYLGIVAYDRNEEVIRVTSESFDQTTSAVTKYNYTFEKKPYRYELFIAENYFIDSFEADVDLAMTFIKARDHYITVSPQPETYYKKSIEDKHEIRTKKYTLKIEEGILTVNNLRFGRIQKKDRIHLEGKKVYINGEVVY